MACAPARRASGPTARPAPASGPHEPRQCGGRPEHAKRAPRGATAQQTGQRAPGRRTRRRARAGSRAARHGGPGAEDGEPRKLSHGGRGPAWGGGGSGEAAVGEKVPLRGQAVGGAQQSGRAHRRREPRSRQRGATARPPLGTAAGRGGGPRPKDSAPAAAGGRRRERRGREKRAAVAEARGGGGEHEKQRGGGQRPGRMAHRAAPNRGASGVQQEAPEPHELRRSCAADDEAGSAGRAASGAPEWRPGGRGGGAQQVRRRSRQGQTLGREARRERPEGGTGPPQRRTRTGAAAQRRTAGSRAEGKKQKRAGSALLMRAPWGGRTQHPPTETRGIEPRSKTERSTDGSGGQWVRDGCQEGRSGRIRGGAGRRERAGASGYGQRAWPRGVKKAPGESTGAARRRAPFMKITRHALPFPSLF